MSNFLHDIQRFAPTPAEAKSRRWIYIPYDRLHDGVGPLAGPCCRWISTATRDNSVYRDRVQIVQT